MGKAASMKKVLNVIKSVFVWLIMIAAVGMMVFTVFSVTTFDQSNRSVFGYKFFIVQSESMSATDFNAGDIVFVKITDPATLQAGDIIAYTSQNSANFGATVTHKIRRLTATEDGEPGFITYGTTTDTDDETIVTYPYVLGKYVGHLPKVGQFFAFLKTTPGYILCILIPFLILIGYNALNCVLLFRRHRQEQLEEIKAEKEQLEEERRQSAEMMKELQALRAQLAQGASITLDVDEAAATEAPVDLETENETETIS